MTYLCKMMLAIADVAGGTGNKCKGSYWLSQGQDRLTWAIEGLALWAVLFAIPFVVWLVSSIPLR
jgi:hypothetical protein